MDNILIIQAIMKKDILIAITKYSPKKVVVLFDNDDDINIEKLKEELLKAYGEFIQFEFKEIFGKNFLDIFAEGTKIIETLYDKDNYNLIANVNTFDDLKGASLLFAFYRHWNLIDKIFFINTKTNQMIELPIIDLEMTEQKIEIIKKLREGFSITQISELLNLSRTTVYKYIRELQKRNLVDEDNKITKAGLIYL
ncbi:MAG: HTH domain-containing protein [Methanobrevibacter sp.]|jgi:CRISPR-associated protein Csa3|nr:HTH domain-containing protein [Methanobrevibacter sp.]